MTLDELRKKGDGSAFLNWMTVEQAKGLEIIPPAFSEYFENYCSCGSENIIKRSASQVMCCNPRCAIKMGYAIAEMFSRFGIKGLQEASCSKIYRSMLRKDRALKEQGKPGLFETKSFVEVVRVPWSEYPDDVRHLSIANDFFVACQTMLSEKVTLPKLISNLAIPDLSKEAEVMFQGYKDFQEIYDDVKKHGSVELFCESKGFHSAMLAHNLRHSMIDIATANELFIQAIKTEGLMKLEVCMTGSISFFGEHTTKDSYLKKCNNLCTDRDGISLLEMKMNSAKGSNPFILYSRESGDSKFLVGQRRGWVKDRFGEHPVLMHTDVFYEFLERMMNQWNQWKEEGCKGNPEEIFWEIVKDSMKKILQKHKIVNPSEMQAF